MKAFRILLLACALAGLTAAAVAQESPNSTPSPDAQQQQRQQSPQTAAPSATPGSEQTAQTFHGTIVKAQGSFVLKDTANNTSYQLDDQDKVKQFEGKSVSITGTLDSAANTIHVASVQPTS
jgi:hypothetical protein